MIHLRSSMSIALLAITLAACGVSEATIRERDAAKIRQYNNVTQKEKDLVDPVHGKLVKMLYGALSGTDLVNANGVAFVKTYENGASSVTVNLNILPPGNDERLVVRLRDGTNSLPIEVGELVSIVGDARHSVSLESKADLSSHTSVEVYQGSVLVAFGTLKSAPVQR